jgi:SAM-dependent methyltransferase
MADEPPNDPAPGAATADADYAERLNRLQNKRWKKILNVQAPYRANLRRMNLGRTLDVGCGNGRNLSYLPEGSVGVDHNPHLVAAARERGCIAYTTEEFFADPALSAAGSFDALLAAHLIEHLTPEEAREVIRGYLPLVRPYGKVVFITPQERGYASDPTHLAFTDQRSLTELDRDLGLTPLKQYSFPFPRAAGKLFIYNEFNHIARVPGRAGGGS